MAEIRLAQISRTNLSVTFLIEGITADRQTYVYIPEKEEFVTLSNAVVQGYIESFETTDAMNGEVTVHMYESIANDYPVWRFLVENCHEGVMTYSSGVFITCLRFDYDNEWVKTSGAEVDLTAEDAKRLNKFAYWLADSYDVNVDYDDYDLGVSRGDTIYGADIQHAADTIYLAADTAEAYGSGVDNASWIKDLLLHFTADISGWLISAEQLTNIRRAINAFDMDRTWTTT